MIKSSANANLLEICAEIVFVEIGELPPTM